MKRRLFLNVLLAATLLLALTGSAGWAQSGPPAPDRGSQLHVVPEAPASSSVNPLGAYFTYQGHLTHNGAPVTGTCNFEFFLYDSDGSQIGGLQQAYNTQVTRGLFTVLLNDTGQFGPNAFQGDARWLAVTVMCPAISNSWITLLPVQLLSPAPYATWASTAGKVVSTVDSAIYVSPHSMVALPDHDGTYGTALRLDFYGYTSIMPVIDAGYHYASLPIPVPGQLFGATVYGKSLDVCYLAGLSAYIGNTNLLHNQLADGSPTTLFGDGHDRSAHSYSCYTVTAPTPRQAIDGSVWLRFGFNFSDTTGNAWVHIYYVKLTLTEQQN